MCAALHEHERSLDTTLTRYQSQPLSSGPIEHTMGIISMQEKPSKPDGELMAKPPESTKCKIHFPLQIYLLLALAGRAKHNNELAVMNLEVNRFECRDCGAAEFVSPGDAIKTDQSIVPGHCYSVHSFEACCCSRHRSMSRSNSRSNQA